MDREELVEKVRRAIQLRRARNEFVSSADLARAALAVAEPVVRADEQGKQQAASKGMCPFDRLDHGGLLPEDPCPICGDLGTLETVGEPSHCVSRSRTGGTP